MANVFRTSVRRCFPGRDRAPLRETILTLARDGGDIRPARTQYALTPSEQITFNCLVAWLARARGEE